MHSNMRQLATIIRCALIVVLPMIVTRGLAVDRNLLQTKGVAQLGDELRNSTERLVQKVLGRHSTSDCSDAIAENSTMLDMAEPAKPMGKANYNETICNGNCMMQRFQTLPRDNSSDTDVNGSEDVQYANNITNRPTGGEEAMAGRKLLGRCDNPDLYAVPSATGYKTSCMVIVRTAMGLFRCSGTFVVDGQHVVTAGHCVWNRKTSSYQIMLDPVTNNYGAVICHPLGNNFVPDFELASIFAITNAVTTRGYANGIPVAASGDAVGVSGVDVAVLRVQAMSTTDTTRFGVPMVLTQYSASPAGACDSPKNIVWQGFPGGNGEANCPSTPVNVLQRDFDAYGLQVFTTGCYNGMYNNALVQNGNSCEGMSGGGVFRGDTALSETFLSTIGVISSSTKQCTFGQSPLGLVWIARFKDNPRGTQGGVHVPTLASQV